MSGSMFSYGMFNKPLSITRSGGDSSAFAYGIERDRYQRVDQIGSDTTTTWYRSPGLGGGSPE